MIRSGWQSALPRRLVLTAVAVLIPALAGCEAGNNAPTLQIHYPANSANATVGDLSVRNVFIVGAPLGARLSPGQSAGLFFAIVNTGRPDRLMSITAPGTAASVALPGAGVTVKYLHPVFFTGPQPRSYLINLTRTVTNGSSLKVVLHFVRAGAVTLQVPVFARALHYLTFGQPPTPTPSATPSVAAGRHRAGKPKASASASASPTPSPSR